MKEFFGKLKIEKMMKKNEKENEKRKNEKENEKRKNEKNQKEKKKKRKKKKKNNERSGQEGEVHPTQFLTDSLCIQLHCSNSLERDARLSSLDSILRPFLLISLSHQNNL